MFKAYQTRVTFIGDKLKDDGSNLQPWKIHFMNHVIDFGQDTILYVPSKLDKDTMVNVLQHGQQLDPAHVQKSIASLKETSWDTYDHSNNKEVLKLLFASVSNGLVTTLQGQDVSQQLSAAETIMALFGIITDTSCDRFNKDIAMIKANSPLKYPGENVATYAKDVLTLVNGLIFANRFPAARCVLYILQAICRVTSDVFRSEFHLRLNKARRASSLYEQLPYAEQAKLLHNEDLDPVTILLESTTTYKNMVDEGYWPPAKNPVDKSSAPEISTMSMPSSLQQMTRQQLDALVQSGGCPQLNALIQSNIDKTKHAIKKDHTCFNCGEAGLPRLSKAKAKQQQQ
jgi:hypothetical protein